MAYAVKVDEITRGLLAECAAEANRTPGKHVKDLIEADSKERGIVAPKAAPKVDTSTGEATGNKVDGFFAWKVRERLGAKS